VRAQVLGSARTSDFEMMRWHLECGRGFLVDETRGTNALMAAASVGSKRVVKLCLRWKFDVTTLDYEGRNVLHYCAQSLMPGANTVLTYLLTHGALDLLDSRDNEGYTPLARAVQGGAVMTAKTLGGVKASLEGPSRTGMSLIHVAATHGRSEMLKSLLNDPCFFGRNQETENEFSKRVTKIAESKDQNGMSALHHSCSAGLLKVVSILVDYGVDVDTLDNEGRTPLHYAVCSQEAECVELLLSGSANPSILDNSGMSALHHAACKNFGPEVSSLCRDTRTNTEQLNCDEETALHCASLLGHLDAVKALCACAADTNNTNPDGDTPLHLAACAGHTEVVRVLLEYVI
jgi:ankyrin repeat protein